MPRAHRLVGLLTLPWMLGGCGLFGSTYQSPVGIGGPPPAIVEVRFDGSDHLDDGTLRVPIEEFMYDLSRDPAREAAAFDARLELEDVYRDAGYPDATVDYSLRRQVGDGGIEQVTVVFRIEEGPQVLVRELELTGNQAYDDEVLTEMWSYRSSGLLGLGDPIFIESDFQALASDIQTFYRTRGFLAASVAAPVIDRTVGEVDARIRIEIDEGPRFAFGTTLVDEGLRRALPTAMPPPPTGAFDLTALDRYARQVDTEIRRAGYPDPTITLHPTPDHTTHLVELQITGDIGRHAHIGEIAIRGNDRTFNGVIRRRMPLRVGDVYDGKAEERGLHQLYLTGLFSKVQVEHEWIDDARIRLVIVVEEVESRSIEALGGYGSYERLRGAVRFEERNVLGTGRQLAVETRVSQRGFRGSTTITDTDILGSDITLSLAGEYFQREEPSFTDEAFGGTATLSRRLFRGLIGRFGYTLRERRDARAEVFAPLNSLVDYTEGRLFLELRNDQRDSPIFPKDGHEQFVLVELVEPALGADVSFFRARIGFTWHIVLHDDIRLVLRDEQGWLVPGEDSANVPLQERFFNGGGDTVRSFRESRLGPVDPNGRPTGGEYLNLFSAELRLPLWRTLETALFADAGNVGSNVSEYGISGLRYAVGAGLRWVLPIGPIRVDFAYNPDRDTGESDWTSHVSVGYPF